MLYQLSYVRALGPTIPPGGPLSAGGNWLGGGIGEPSRRDDDVVKTRTSGLRIRPFWQEVSA